MGDNAELEALFEQARAAAEASRAAAAQPSPSGDAQRVAEAPASDPQSGCNALYTRVGRMTRMLHDTLRELGYDRALEQAATALPDARERLAYIASRTGQAAERTLDAAEAARSHLGPLQAASAGLGARWERVYAGEADVAEFRRTADDTREFLGAATRQAAEADARLTDIMLAQDFHDLTGQVIRGIVKLAADMERDLVALLVESSPGGRSDSDGAHFQGPVINAAGRSDVVTSQKEVDALLESLGF